MAGTIVAVGENVRVWKEGDRVCANFALDHIDGDPTPEIMKSAQGSDINGVLSEYITVPSHVRSPRPSASEAFADYEPGSLSCASLRLFLSKRPRLSRTFFTRDPTTLPDACNSCAAVTAYNSFYGPNPLKAGDTVLVIGTGGVSMFAPSCLFPSII